MRTEDDMGKRRSSAKKSSGRSQARAPAERYRRHRRSTTTTAHIVAWQCSSKNSMRSNSVLRPPGN